MTKRFLIAASLIFFMVGVITPFARSAEAPRITMEKLKEMIGNPDLVIIDVRTESDWKGTDLKITGAVREDPSNSKSWAQKYPKDKALVLYCA